MSPPPEESDRLPAVLVPLSTVDESWLIFTAPGELNVSEPRARTSPAALPRSIDAPEKLALLVTRSPVLGASVMAPAEVSDRLEALFKPASCVPLASAMVTAPPAKLRLPKLFTPVSVMASLPDEKAALLITDNVAPAPSVMAPPFA